MAPIGSRFRQHTLFSSRLTVFAAICALFAYLLWSASAQAQTPPNFRTPGFALPDVESSISDAENLPDSASALRRVIVDTDPGVDDAAALIWLFSQNRYEVDVVGIVTVAGNTNVDFAVNNAQLILDWLEEDVPLVRGSEGPLVQMSSLVPSLIHGPDGLWFTYAPTATPDSIDPTAFYCGGNVLQPGTLVIALGPLTNIAKAIDGANGGCPTKWNGVEIVSLGGSRAKPNQTPVTEYNYWQDPEAVEKVLSLGPNNGATVQIVLSDAFSQFEIGASDLRQAERRGVDAIKNLLPTLTTYIGGLAQGGETPTLPDPTAMIYALENGLGTSQSALVQVLAGENIPEVVRGQTIIGLTLNERITMIADDAQLSDIAFRVYTDPDFNLELELGNILFSQPDNAVVVTDIDARRMHTIFTQGLRAKNTTPTSGNGEEIEEGDFEMYVPFVID